MAVASPPAMHRLAKPRALSTAISVARTRAALAHRAPKGGRAAVDVELLVGDVELTRGMRRHDRESIVDFVKIDVGFGPPCFAERLAHRWRWCCCEQGGCTNVRRMGCDHRRNRKAEPLGDAPPCHQEPDRTVAKRRGVGSGDRAPTRAWWKSGPIRRAIMSLATCSIAAQGPSSTESRFRRFVAPLDLLFC
jgi:hypothetical protein